MVRGTYLALIVEHKKNGDKLGPINKVMITPNLPSAEATLEYISKRYTDDGFYWHKGHYEYAGKDFYYRAYIYERGPFIEGHAEMKRTGEVK